MVEGGSDIPRAVSALTMRARPFIEWSRLRSSRLSIVSIHRLGAACSAVGGERRETVATTREMWVAESGLSVNDLPEIYRVEFLHAIELVRAEHSPDVDWDGFVEALWEALVPAFGLDMAVDEPSSG